jgi:hypothetical protein
MDPEVVLAEPLAAEPSVEIDAQVEQTEVNTEAEAKPEKTPEQRALERAEKKIGRLVRQREELRAELNHGRGLQTQANQGDNQTTDSDSDSLTLSRAELAAMVKKEATKLAPTITQQSAEVEQRRQSAGALAKELGHDRFIELTDDLAEILPAAAQLLVLETDAPRALLEYLTDPDNEAEARAISRLSEGQAGRAIARLEAKLAGSKGKDKDVPSKSAAPLEALRGKGGGISADPDTSKWTDDQWMRHRAKQRQPAR